MITILDGGMGRELKRQGAPFRQPEWSALALMEAPETVLEAHRAFAAAGAEVLTTNSYAVVPFHIGAERFAADGARLAALSGSLARQAAGPGVRVAASLPPVLGSYRPDLFDAGKARPILATLVEALRPHADIWLAETLSSVAEARLVREVIGDDPRPLWLSFTLADGEEDEAATLRSGEHVGKAVRAAQAVGAAALLFNCSQPEAMGAALAVARQNTRTALGIYANAFPAQRKDAKANSTLLDIRTDLDPPNYLAHARAWVAAGASIIGGCCGIGPEHIRELSRGLKEPAGVA